jgi:hypothetical protein
MHTASIRAFVSILCTTLGSACAPTTDLAADLASAAQRFEHAQIAGDATALEELVSADYVLVNADGAVESRRQFIADWTAADFDPDPVTVRDPIRLLWRDGAALGGLVTLTGSQAGERFSVTFRYLDLWQRRGGRWQVIRGQATRVTDAAAS